MNYQIYDRVRSWTVGLERGSRLTSKHGTDLPTLGECKFTLFASHVQINVTEQTVEMETSAFDQYDCQIWRFRREVTDRGLSRTQHTQKIRMVASSQLRSPTGYNQQHFLNICWSYIKHKWNSSHFAEMSVHFCNVSVNSCSFVNYLVSSQTCQELLHLPRCCVSSIFYMFSSPHRL